MADAPAAKKARTGASAGEASSVLAEDAVEAFVQQAVADVQAIDLHTHLFPPSHGALMLYGIDELLTYHYLVCEFFQTYTEITHEAFFKLPKSTQGDMIWEALFVQRSPLSEQCQGVLTVLSRLGLADFARARDLVKIRAWFAEQDPTEYTQKVLELAGLRYVVMTNIPFDPVEAAEWKAGKKLPSTFKSALRVDPLLAGNWTIVSKALEEGGFEQSLEGAKDYLREWARVMQPIYLMASTPAGFTYGRDNFAETQDGWCACCARPYMLDAKDTEAVAKRSIALGRRPAAAPAAAAGAEPAAKPKVSGEELLTKVLLPIAMELNLPIALKVGAMRGVNPALRQGQDGVEVADLGSLRRLLTDFPQVKFCATVLSDDNQHELAVLGAKFANLHVYGCWWFCNNPSMIKRITNMRVEILGTAFTAQHSDSRVLDQLIYKWTHSRRVIGRALGIKYREMVEAGWSLTEAEVKRDVHRLFGGAFEEFIAKDSSKFSWKSSVKTWKA